MPFPAQRDAQYLPQGPSSFIAVMDVDDHTFETFQEAQEKTKKGSSYAMSDGAVWVKDKRRTRQLPVGRGEPFRSCEAMATYSYDDRRFYVVKKKSSHGQVKYLKLPPAEQKVFDKSRAKEVSCTGAATILSREESKKFIEKYGQERVIDSLWVDRYKPTEEGPEAKSRWCAVGWQDPDVLDIERSAPTPTTTSMYAAMQVAATGVGTPT